MAGPFFVHNRATGRPRPGSQGHVRAFTARRCNAYVTGTRHPGQRGEHENYAQNVREIVRKGTRRADHVVGILLHALLG